MYENLGYFYFVSSSQPLLILRWQEEKHIKCMSFMFWATVSFLYFLFSTNILLFVNEITSQKYKLIIIKEFYLKSKM